MKEMIAYCGLLCHECPAFLATIADDDVKRQEVAEMWSKEFHADIKAEQINCTGCLTIEGVLFGHCQVCAIRKCGLEKQVKNCAYCSDYSCDKLNEFFAMVPAAKKTLDAIHKSI